MQLAMHIWNNTVKTVKVIFSVEYT